MFAETARICAGLHEEGWRLVLAKLDERTTNEIRDAVADMFEDCARTIRPAKAFCAVAGDLG
jgi:hypothetical protein